MPLRRLRREDYTVGWVCALPIELAAAQQMLDAEHHHIPDEHDPTLYTLGRIGEHNVVIASLPAGQIGTQSAAAVATQMRSKFISIRFGLLVGIGGGIPSARADVRLGDVVVSQPEMGHGGVVQYDFGKSTTNGFVRTGFLNTPPAILLNAVAHLRAKQIRRRSSFSKYLSAFSDLPVFSRENTTPDVLFKSTYEHGRGDTCENCSSERVEKRVLRENSEVNVHYGAIASGNQVIKDAILRDRISADLNGAICFEMEAAGLMNSFPCLVIRGICDYSDSHKNKKWQPYAAATAAAYAKELLSVIPTTDILAAQTANEVTIKDEIHRSIEDLNLTELISVLSVVDQDQYISDTQSSSLGDPIFYWIFRDIDFLQWSSSKNSQVLWISGPPNCKLNQASSHIINQEKCRDSNVNDLVLYFLCASSIKKKSTISCIVHTLLCQVINYIEIKKRISIMRTFWYTLLREAFKKEADPNWKNRGFEEDSPEVNIHKLLDAPMDALFKGLEAVLYEASLAGVTIIVDGLDNLHSQGAAFINQFRALTERLQLQAQFVKILVTSDLKTNLNGALDRATNIEYDKERKECLRYLRFHNTRYEKISEAHENSYEWLWTHRQYKEWSDSRNSQLLYLQGKPGSGKSTLTKYFKDNLFERDEYAKRAIMAQFFYSYRESEMQRSHYNMLRSILYHILEQNDSFFYHYQQAHRKLMSLLKQQSPPSLLEVEAQHYELLKKVTLSLADHPHKEDLYLIIDAVDESDDKDRRDILELLLRLCSVSKNIIVKVFIASRPISIINYRASEFHYSIRLQDETKNDISKFTNFFLEHRLKLGTLNYQVVAYILEHAQGVFLWVKLVCDELLDYVERGNNSENTILAFLKSLPTELEEFYTHILLKLETNRNIDDRIDGAKLLRFVLFAFRPLEVAEIHHVLGVSDDPDALFTLHDQDFQRCIPASHDATERRIHHCGGNLLEIKMQSGNRMVQIMHQTVRDFFLRPGSMPRSDFYITEQHAHTRISVACLRYLILCVNHGPKAKSFEEVNSWGLKQFDNFAEYLNSKTLTNYAMKHLHDHVNCSLDVNTTYLLSLLFTEISNSPVFGYFCQTWLYSFDKKLIPKQYGQVATVFRNNVLHSAVRKQFFRVVDALLGVGADVNGRVAEKTALIASVQASEDVNIVKFLVSQGAKIEAEDADKWTAVHWAARMGRVNAMKFLLESGASSKGTSDQRPLHLAAREGHTEIASMLLKYNANIDAKDGTKWTALHHASAEGHEVMAKLLIDAGANWESHDRTKWTPIFCAASGGHESVVRLLIDQGAGVEIKDQYRWTPLQWAVQKGHEGVARLLVKNGANIEVRDQMGRSPLHRAESQGHQAVARFLLEKGADTETTDRNGHNALHWAALKGLDTVVATILTLLPTVDLEAKNKNGLTPLHCAASAGHEGVARILVLNQPQAADMAAVDDNGLTPLHWAAKHGHSGVVKLLLRNGADVDAEDHLGHTPLRYAASRRHDTIMRLLIAHGANETKIKDMR